MYTFFSHPKRINPESGRGSFVSIDQSVFLERSSDYDKNLAAATHEFLHAKSHNKLKDKTYKRLFGLLRKGHQVETYRSGLIVVRENERVFDNLNEAIAENITSKICWGDIKNTLSPEQLKTFEEFSQELGVKIENLYRFGKSELEKGTLSIQNPYLKQLQIYKKLIDTVAHNLKIPSDEVEFSFEEAFFTGKLHKVAHMLDNACGAGTFMGLAQADTCSTLDPVESSLNSPTNLENCVNLLISESTKKEAANKEIKENALKDLKRWMYVYDYSKFTWESMYDFLKKIKIEIKKDENTYNYDLNSFEQTELTSLLRELEDILLTQKQKWISSVEKGSKESLLLSTGNWDMGYDGKLKPLAQNPILLGGVHGNEKTLPDELDKFLSYNKETGQYKLDSTKAYVNHKVNSPALGMGVRSYSTTDSRASEDADMNRSEIVDEVTKKIKEETLSQISGFERPFILDMHNDDKNEMPYAAFTVPDNFSPNDAIDDSLLFKIKLAEELGLKNFTMVDPEFANGTMVGDAKIKNKNADGMIIEVPSNDTSNMSAKIALKYLSMNNVVTGLGFSKTSVPFQLENSLNDSFLAVTTDDEIEIVYYKVNKNVDENLHPKNQVPDREYMIRNNVPIEVQKLKIKNGFFTSD